ncbi:flagellar protein FlaG [Variovorax boronicumulans]|uniref:flagellar protein FlaG n=1 Tax=Variovorax boronicumulans TaxID=436515 RepID=UPI0027807277|nr:flagellar protein FlaG [Variovorax boronicumulans]MDQ0085893.1 flagellar protein FlaG [Variovorax boronicumulans]
MMLNPVPATPVMENQWTQLLVGGAAAVRGLVAGAKGDAAADAKDDATPVQVEQAVHQVNEAFALREVGLQFEVDKDTDKVIVKVVDRASGEVIRQIPNEDVVRIAKLMSDGSGLLVDHAA